MQDEISIRLHESDIKVLQKEKRVLLKRLAEIERDIITYTQYNRQIKEKEDYYDRL